jgi:hypothetical protein
MPLRGLPRPSFPFPRVLPWALGAISATTLALGMAGRDAGAILIGAVGLAFIALAYGAARLLRRTEPPGDGEDT